MQSISSPNLVQIKKKIDLCSDLATQLLPNHALSVIIILEGKHSRALALLAGDYLAIDPCGISSPLFMGKYVRT